MRVSADNTFLALTTEFRRLFIERQGGVFVVLCLFGLHARDLSLRQGFREAYGSRQVDRNWACPRDGRVPFPPFGQGVTVWHRFRALQNRTAESASRAGRKIVILVPTMDRMVAKRHFQRLKNIYTSNPGGSPGDRVAISYGRAELDGHVNAADSESVVNRMSHHRLLSDVASLAAGTLEKEHFVTAEHFLVDVEKPNYEGPVAAMAEVVMVEPPLSVVEATLLSEEGELIAEATGVFGPSEDPLPSDASPDEEAETGSTLTPASFMPVYSTPYGVLCLN